MSKPEENICLTLHRKRERKDSDRLSQDYITSQIQRLSVLCKSTSPRLIVRYLPLHTGCINI